MAAVLDHCHTLTGWPLNMSDIKQHLGTEMTYLPHMGILVYLTHRETQTQTHHIITTENEWPENLKKYLLWNVPHLEEESITHWVAEAEDKIFLRVFGNSLHNAVFNPQRMFGNTVVVNSRTTVGLVQEEGASFKNIEEIKRGRGTTNPKMFLCY